MWLPTRQRWCCHSRGTVATTDTGQPLQSVPLSEWVSEWVAVLHHTSEGDTATTRCMWTWNDGTASLYNRMWQRCIPACCTQEKMAYTQIHFPHTRDCHHLKKPILPHTAHTVLDCQLHYGSNTALRASDTETTGTWGHCPLGLGWQWSGKQLALADNAQKQPLKCTAPLRSVCKLA